MNIYYIYMYRHPDTLNPFYVGMGKGRRVLYHIKEAEKNLTPKKGEHKLNIIRQLLREGKNPIIEIVKSNLTKEIAFALEIELISKYGRQDLGTGILTNQTMGGEGGNEWSEEKKNEARERNHRLGIVPPSQKGRKQNRRPEYTAIPAKVINTGKTIKALLSDPRWLTNEIVGINKGIIQNEEWRRKNSESNSLLKWWNNGVRSVRTINCPGTDFILGRGKIK